MLKRLAFAGAALTLGVAGTWKVALAEYFGRVDLDRWAATNPIPPSPPSESGPHRITLVGSRRALPSEGMPQPAPSHAANNNLDVLRHDGRVFLAWRSAPSHFASEEVVVHVASSADELTWTHEATFALRRDLREPRLLSLNGRLLLYVARLGDAPFRFEPEGLSLSERRADGSWSELEPVGPRGAIVWRAKVHAGEGLMVLYRGGENLYAFNGRPMTVELWRTADGRTFRPYADSGPVVLSGGGTETDFAVDASKTLFAVVRNEAGDESGAGSKLCRGDGVTLGGWVCKTDRRKYDSPLVFEHEDEIYVVGRRNLSGDGRYDVSGRTGALGIIQNELSYITTAKRCAVWRWVKPEDRLAFVMDLPSRGDTCFPSKLEGAAPSRVVIYDYSSDVDGPELPWSAGQRLPTYIYRHELAFERR